MEDTINLKGLFQMLRKRFWIITFITIIAMTISGVISFFVLTPVYQAKTQILVNETKSDQQLYNTQTVQTNVQLISTYNDIITSPAILEKVINKLNLKTTPQALSSKIQVTNAKDSQVAQILVQDTSASRATRIANTTAAVFQKEIPKIMNVDNVSVLSEAMLGENAAPIKPQPLLNIAVALVAGLMLGIGISLLLEYLDNTIKTEKDIENILGVPVIGVIANIKEIPKETTTLNSKANSLAKQRGQTYES